MANAHQDYRTLKHDKNVNDQDKNVQHTNEEYKNGNNNVNNRYSINTDEVYNEQGDKIVDDDKFYEEGRSSILWNNNDDADKDGQGNEVNDDNVDNGNEYGNADWRNNEDCIDEKDNL